jgi:alpha-tubulin suppressor-like RCC1 family protein
MLTNQGRVFLWGNYAQGAFGTIRFKFTHILDLKFLKKEEKIVNICVGFQKTFLITDKNRLFAFGANRNGSLGDGTEVDRFEPLDITNKFKR